MTDQLPWDKYPTPAAEPELPYVPPAEVVEPIPLPPRPPSAPADADVKALASDLLNEAMSYAKGVIGEISKGHTVDVLNPRITSTTGAGRELVIADAKSRSWRTLIQGLAFDVMAAIVAAVALLSGADPMDPQVWAAFGVLLLKSVVSAVISYFMRLRVTPTIKVPGEKMAVMPVPRPIIKGNKEIENNDRP